jgi:hypothetical protein
MGTDYRSLYGKDYVGSWDIPDGKDITVTISSVSGGELAGVGGRKSKKPLLTLKGTAKKLALNATNGKTIATMYGKDIEGWVGKKISLYKSTTRDPNGDGETECIRVRPRVPVAGPSSPATSQVPAEEAPISDEQSEMQP